MNLPYNTRLSYSLSLEAIEHGKRYQDYQSADPYVFAELESAWDYWLRYWESLPTPRKRQVFLAALIRSLLSGGKDKRQLEFSVKFAQNEELAAQEERILRVYHEEPGEAEEIDLTVYDELFNNLGVLSD